MVNSSSGGSGFKPGMVSSHGWVERGSSQVIGHKKLSLDIC